MLQAASPSPHHPSSPRRDYVPALGPPAGGFALLPHPLGVLRGGRGGGYDALEDALGQHVHGRASQNGEHRIPHERGDGARERMLVRSPQKGCYKVRYEAQDVEVIVHYILGALEDFLCRGERAGTRGIPKNGTKKAGVLSPAACDIRLSGATRRGGIRSTSRRHLTSKGRPEGTARGTTRGTVQTRRRLVGSCLLPAARAPRPRRQDAVLRALRGEKKGKNGLPAALHQM